MKKIKVLHYGLSDNCGGIENVVFSWFKNKSDDVVFDFINDDKATLAYEDEFVRGGSRILYMEKRFEHPFKRFMSFRKILEENDYDYFHYHVMNNDEIGLIIACNQSKKTKPVIHCHSMYTGEVPFKEKILLSEFKFLGMHQDYYRLSCAEKAGKNMFGDQKFTVIENGVNFDKYRFSKIERANIRCRYGFSDTDKVIGHIGHVCPEKNYPFIFEVFSKLKKLNMSFKLLLVGNVDNNKWIRAKLEEYDIVNETYFTGVVKDVAPLYSAMDLFFLPSVSEGFPVSLVEAQVNGLPCVTSVAVTQETGISDDIVYLDFDSETVKEYVLKLINKAKDREHVAVSDRLDIRNTTEKLMRFYRDSLWI